MVAVIRYLKPNEPIPSGEPRRYKSPSGYVRLRWKVGKREYIECLEHRLVMGVPDAHVHHKNEIRDDNRPENLEVLSPSLHQAEHREIDTARASELHESGASIPQIARLFGRNHAAIFRAMKRDGFHVRSLAEANGRKRVAFDEGMLRRLFDAGVSDRRIAAELGTQKTLIRSRRDEMGIAPQRPGRQTLEAARSAEAAVRREFG